jgi:hypothetical protein
LVVGYLLKVLPNKGVWAHRFIAAPIDIVFEVFAVSVEEDGEAFRMV